MEYSSLAHEIQNMGTSVNVRPSPYAVWNPVLENF